MTALVVYCTCPDAMTAERISHALIAERVAACVNRINGVRSTYRWEGVVHDNDEILLLIKTTRERYAEVQTRIVELHPYELPEVLAVEPAAGLERYLAWIDSETRRD